MFEKKWSKILSIQLISISTELGGMGEHGQFRDLQVKLISKLLHGKDRL